MSLWKKTKDNPLSAPTWYARHCYFDGKTTVADGKINLRKANTQFEVGDALLYVAPSDDKVLGGLTNKGVYYVKAINSWVYTLASTRGGAAITVTATADASKQMFIKCDTYETTNDGTLNYAIIPVTVTEAKSAKYGKTINSQGWWRYRRFTKVGSTTATVHAELLVSFKGDFVTEVPQGGINDPSKDLDLGNVVVPPTTGNIAITGKSVGITNLDAKDVTGYVNITAKNGNVDIEGASLWAAPLQVTAE